MKIRYSPAIIKKLKKLDVRIRKSFKERIELFEKDPLSPQLHNHDLRNEYEGFKSINITTDYRAIYRETTIGEETFIYFTFFGTHKELYG